MPSPEEVSIGSESVIDPLTALSDDISGGRKPALEAPAQWINDNLGTTTEPNAPSSSFKELLHNRDYALGVAIHLGAIAIGSYVVVKSAKALRDLTTHVR